MELRALLIQGKFTEDDFRELLQVLRAIEQRHPEELFYAMAVNPLCDPTSEEAVELLEKTYPTRPGHELMIFSRPRRRTSPQG